MPRDVATSVRAVVRVRPLLPHELGRGEENCCEVRDSTSILIQSGPVNRQWRQYSFDACLPGEKTQKQVFQECGVTSLIDSAVVGYAGTILTYGQTGSGKTYSMIGRIGSSDAAARGGDGDVVDKEDGLIMRSARRLFRRICGDGAPADASFSVSASFTEIYNAPGAVNECISDLLSPEASGKSLQVRYNQKHGFYITDLCVVDCRSVADVRAVLDAGVQNRKIGAHALNKDSSRSHALFTMYIDSEGGAGGDGQRSRRFGKVTFVDLAGSERLKESLAEGHARKETQAINKSLFTLGQVISQLAQGKTDKHVPYRNSKLTQLLQESFGGEALCLMVTCISPAMVFAEESLNSLNYAQKAMNIRNRPVVRLDERQQLLHDLQTENAALRRELEVYRAKFGVLSPRTLEAGPAAATAAATLVTGDLEQHAIGDADAAAATGGAGLGGDDGGAGEAGGAVAVGAALAEASNLSDRSSKRRAGSAGKGAGAVAGGGGNAVGGPTPAARGRGPRGEVRAAANRGRSEPPAASVPALAHIAPKVTTPSATTSAAQPPPPRVSAPAQPPPGAPAAAAVALSATAAEGGSGGVAAGGYAALAAMKRRGVRAEPPRRGQVGPTPAPLRRRESCRSLPPLPGRAGVCGSASPGDGVSGDGSPGNVAGAIRKTPVVAEEATVFAASGGVGSGGGGGGRACCSGATPSSTPPAKASPAACALTAAPAVSCEILPPSRTVPTLTAPLSKRAAAEVAQENDLVAAAPAVVHISATATQSVASLTLAQPPADGPTPRVPSASNQSCSTERLASPAQLARAISSGRNSREEMPQVTKKQLDRLDRSHWSEWQFQFGQGGSASTDGSSASSGTSRGRSNSSRKSVASSASSESSSPRPGTSPSLLRGQRSGRPCEAASDGAADGPSIAAMSMSTASCTPQGAAGAADGFHRMSIAQLNSKLSSMAVATSALLQEAKMQPGTNAGFRDVASAVSVEPAFEGDGAGGLA